MKWVVISSIAIAGAIAALVVALGADASGDKAGGSVEKPAAEESGTAGDPGGGDPPDPVASRPRRFSGSATKVDPGSAHRVFEAIDEQDTDSDWAPGQTKEIQRIADAVIDGAPVKVTDIECRTSRCRLVVTSSDSNAFMAVLEKMQGSGGYFGVASSLYLEDLRKSEDGTQQVDVFLDFDRGP